jgi:hypothetical protein
MDPWALPVSGSPKTTPLSHILVLEIPSVTGMRMFADFREGSLRREVLLDTKKRRIALPW